MYTLSNNKKKINQHVKRNYWFRITLFFPSGNIRYLFQCYNMQRNVTSSYEYIVIRN